MVGVKPEIVLGETQQAVHENRLYRCLTCDAITIYNTPSDWFRPGGSLHSLAIKTHKELSADKHYSFPTHGKCNIFNFKFKLKNYHLNWYF